MLPEHIVKEIHKIQMTRKNKVIEEQNKICDNIYSSIVDTITNNPVSGSKVIDIKHTKNNNNGYFDYYSECIDNMRFKTIKRQINIDYYAVSGVKSISQYENLKLEYNFKEHDLLSLTVVKK
jgi:hypothetical protein